MSSQSHTTESGSGSRKIRDSCTSCSLQKLRCSKERPSCERCRTRNIECNYVVSMRTGRPPRSAKSTSNSSNTSASASGSSRNVSPNSPVTTSFSAQDFDFGLPATSAPITGPTSAPPMWAPSPGLESLLQPVSLNMSDDTLWNDQASINFSNELDSLFADTTGMQGFSPFMPFGDQTMSDLTASTSAPPQMASNNITSHSPLFTPPMQSSQQDSWSGQSVVPRGGGGRRTTLPPRMPSFAKQQQQQQQQQSQPSSASNRPCRSNSHNGMSVLFDLTLEMSVSDQRCNTAANMRQQHRQQSRDVDAVLFRNREAIRTITKTLDCPCWTDPSITLAAYMLAAKIVAWYGAILFVDGESLLDGEASTIADCIIARPISVGTYRLDSKAQRSVRATVVLGELQGLVQPMIDRMVLVKSSSVGDVEKPDAIALADCMLRQQMRRIITAAS